MNSTTLATINDASLATMNATPLAMINATTLETTSTTTLATINATVTSMNELYTTPIAVQNFPHTTHVIFDATNATLVNATHSFLNNATTDPLSHNKTTEPEEFDRAKSVAAGGLLIVMGFVGNCLLLQVTVTLVRRKLDHYIYVCSMAVADLIISSYVLTFVVVDLAFQVKIAKCGPACTFNGVFFITAGFASVLSVFVLSVNRYLHVCKKKWYALIFSADINLIVSLGIWVTGLLASLPSLFDKKSGYGYDTKLHVCIYDRHKNYYFSVTGFTMVCIICGLVFVLLGQIWVTDRHLKVRQRMCLEAGLLMETEDKEQQQQPSNSPLPAHKAHRATTLPKVETVEPSDMSFVWVLGITNCLRLVLSLPFVLVSLVDKHTEQPANLHLVVFYMMLANASVNWLAFPVLDPTVQNVFAVLGRRVNMFSNKKEEAKDPEKPTELTETQPPTSTDPSKPQEQEMNTENIDNDPPTKCKEEDLSWFEIAYRWVCGTGDNPSVSAPEAGPSAGFEDKNPGVSAGAVGSPSTPQNYPSPQHGRFSRFSRTSSPTLVESRDAQASEMSSIRSPDAFALTLTRWKGKTRQNREDDPWKRRQATVVPPWKLNSQARKSPPHKTISDTLRTGSRRLSVYEPEPEVSGAGQISVNSSGGPRSPHVLRISPARQSVLLKLKLSNSLKTRLKSGIYEVENVEIRETTTNADEVEENSGCCPLIGSCLRAIYTKGTV